MYAGSFKISDNEELLGEKLVIYLNYIVRNYLNCYIKVLHVFRNSVYKRLDGVLYGEVLSSVDSKKLLPKKY